ncbi:hypothetical protein ACH5A7_34455 [Streptomyces sp. NPDC018955]|uniref:hypothetical protein n=1 Tax=Streptomyces sp. NPDC018955 TaxID=3365055 RepID=UPI00378A0E42
MAVSEDLLWDAADKSTRTAPRLLRTAVAAGCLGLVLWAVSDAMWAIRAVAACVLVGFAYLVWDRRRLVEVRIVAGEAGGPARLRLRHAGGRTTDHDPQRVARVLVVHDNVVDSAKLRLRLRKGPLFFGRPGRAPELAAWRETCPRAAVGSRGALWGMPGIPD